MSDEKPYVSWSSGENDFERAIQNLREAELSMKMAMDYPGEAVEKRINDVFELLHILLKYWSTGK